VIVPRAPPALRSGTWTRALAGFVAGGLIAGSIGNFGLGLPDLLLACGGIVLLLIFFRRRRGERVPSGRPAVPFDRTTTEDHPGDGSSLDGGVRAIRRTDPGFDPARFAGWAAMVFRDAQAAWMTRDIGSLRDRVTPELYGELHAQCDRLRGIGQANHVERIEIAAEVTEAWQESERDYLTACIRGSIVDYTVDEATDSLVRGSRTIPRTIEEFWRFTRPAGLNFWMLSAIEEPSR